MQGPSGTVVLLAIGMATVAHAGSPQVEIETLDGGPDLAAVWASDDTIWVAGAKSELRVRRGASGAWTREKVPLLVDFTDLAGTSAADVWLAGTAGGLARWDGMTWSSTTGENTSEYTAIAPVTRTLVAATSAKRLLVYDGTHWDSVRGRPSFKGLRAVAPLDARGRFLAVGAGGLVVSVDGTKWEKVSAGTTEDLSAVGACAGGEVVAVGAATVKRDAKGRWKTLAPPPAPVRAAVLRCDGSRARTVAAVSEKALHFLDVKKNEWTSVQLGEECSGVTDLARHGEDLVFVGRQGLFGTVTGW